MTIFLGDGPSYAEMAEWRHVLNRLCKFLRLIDFILQDLYHRLMLTAMRQLQSLITESNNADAEDVRIFRCVCSFSLQYILYSVVKICFCNEQ